MPAEWTALSSRSSAASSPVLAHQFCLSEHVTLHRTVQFVPANTSFHIELAVHCVQPEEIAMRLARRRTRSAIADPLEVVVPLASPILEGVVLGNTLGQCRRLRWNVPDNPMGPSAHRSIRIICNQAERLRSGRSPRPGQSGKTVNPVASVFRGNSLSPSRKARS